eukprot:7860402-Pyramimonas_sp.AAC.1
MSETRAVVPGLLCEHAYDMRHEYHFGVDPYDGGPHGNSLHALRLGAEPEIYALDACVGLHRSAQGEGQREYEVFA